MWFQALIVFGVVACCVVYLIRSLLLRVSGTSNGCSGCGGCSQNRPKVCTQTVVFHLQKRSDL